MVSGLLLGSSLSAADLTLVDANMFVGTTYTLMENSTLTMSGTNTSSGTENNIVSFPAITVDGNNNYTIDIINNGTYTVTNSGTNAMDTIGIKVFNLGNSSASSITNNGTINVNSLGTARGVFAILPAGSTVSNTGTITVEGSTISNALRLACIEPNGTASNSGTITAKVNGVFDTNGYALYYDSGYNQALGFTNSSTGVMNGNIYLTKGTFSNEGTLSLPHNATNAVIETFTNEATGTLEIGLQTDGTTTTHSKLSTTNATFNDGSTINVNVLSGSTNVGTLAGDTFSDVVSASTALTINGTLNITDNSALLNFERVVNDATTIDLKAVQAQSVGQTITGNNSNATAAAGALQNIIDNSGSYTGMNGVITALNNLSTNSQVASAVDSTTPQTTTSSFTASNQISNNMSNIVTQRQTITMNSSTGATGANSGDELLSQKNFWVKPYGSMGESRG